LGRETDLGRTSREEEFNELRQSLVALPGGGFAAAWTDVELTASSGIPYRSARLQYVSASGALTLPAGGLLLSPFSSSFLGLVDNHPVLLAPHPTSGVFVAYGRGNPYPWQIVVQWVDGEGRIRWPEAGVSAFGPEVEWTEYENPHVVAADDGGVFVCAARFVFFTFQNRPIVCQYIDATGEPRWGANGIEAGGQRGDHGLPKGVRDGQGGLIVVWLNTRYKFDRRVDPILVEGQRFAVDGRRLWGAKGKLVRRTNLNLPHQLARPGRSDRWRGRGRSRVQRLDP
jgi:hypothetical protein